MIATARAKFMRGSARKARLVADQIRGKKVDEALDLLKFSPRSASGLIETCLRSAIGNALDADGTVDLDNFVISHATVDGGPIMKRIRPAAQGRAFRIRKRFSHITIKISNVEEK
jgi:large subunit ribosomal protein L22